MLSCVFHFNCVPVDGEPGPLVEAWRAFWQHGHLGVPVFFVISGFCITLTWLRSPAWSEFCLRRMRRIMPPYYASVLLVLGMAAAFKLIKGVNDMATLPKTGQAVLATMTLTTAPITDITPLNGVYWTLSCEVTYYLLMAGLLALPISWRVKGLVILHAMMSCLTTFHFGTGSLATLTGMWPLFGVGAAVALWAGNRSASKMMVACNILQAVVMFMTGRPYEYPGWAMVTVGLLWLASRVPFPSQLKPALIVGTFSYSLYLVHQPVGNYGLKRLLPDACLSPNAYAGDALFLGGQLIVFLGTVVIAYIFFRLFEAPFMNAPRPATNAKASLA